LLEYLFDFGGRIFGNVRLWSWSWSLGCARLVAVMVDGYGRRYMFGWSLARLVWSGRGYGRCCMAVMVADYGSYSADGVCSDGRSFRTCRLDSGNRILAAKAPSAMNSPILGIQATLFFVLTHFEDEFSTLYLILCKGHSPQWN